MWEHQYQDSMYYLHIFFIVNIFSNNIISNMLNPLTKDMLV